METGFSVAKMLMDFAFSQSYNTAMKTTLSLIVCGALASCVITENPDGTVTKTLDQSEVRFWAELFKPFLPAEKAVPIADPITDDK